MKTNFKPVALSLFFLASYTVFGQQEPVKVDINFTKDDILTNTTHYRLEIEAAQISYVGKQAMLGSGGRFLAHHFVGDFSAEVGYLQRWMARIPYEQKVGFTEFENVKAFLGREFSFAIGFSFYNKPIDKKEFHSLKQGKTNKIVEMPARVHKVFDLKLGFLYYDLPGQVTFTNNANFNTPTVQFMQQTRSISFGISKKKLQHDIYTTDLFGKVKQSIYGELFLEALFGLGESFPTALYRPTYPAGNAVEEPTGYTAVNATTLEQIKSGMKYNRFGGQLGYRSGSMKHGFGATVLIGYRPGYISQQEIGFLDNLSGSFSLCYHFPFRKKTP